MQILCFFQTFIFHFMPLVMISIFIRAMEIILKRWDETFPRSPHETILTIALINIQFFCTVSEK